MNYLALLKKTVLFCSLLFLTIYLPLTTVLYSSFWYRANCNWHGRCEKIGFDRAYQGIDELVDFFSHRENTLPSRFWSVKEKNHLSEVRGITDSLLIVAAIMIAGVGLTRNAADIRRFSMINIIIILSLIAILPFFAYFWRHIFHPLLFNNRNWLNTPFDLSFYIMPRNFFKFTLIYLISVSCLLNSFIYGIFRLLKK